MAQALPLLAALALGLAVAPAASGWIPEPERVARAAARANDAAGRVRPLRIEVRVAPKWSGEDEAQGAGSRGPGAAASEASADGAAPAPAGPLARGELLVDPTGRARLELHHRAGFRERQLRLGHRLQAWRDGAPVGEPAPLLPPLEPLLADSAAELLGWLAGHGAPRDAELAYDGPHDAIVLGTRGGAALWVDQESYEIVRIDREDGTRYRLGPARRFGAARLPAWIDIEMRGRPPLRIELEEAAPATPSATAFTPAWGREPPPRPDPVPDDAAPPGSAEPTPSEPAAAEPGAGEAPSARAPSPSSAPRRAR